MNEKQSERLRACLKHHGASEEWLAYAMPGLTSEIDAMLSSTASAAHARGLSDAPRPSTSYSAPSPGFDATSFVMGSLLNPF